MAIDPSILRAMQAAGATTDIIIAAVEADAAIDAQRLAEKRAKDAERQRKHRARNAPSRDVTVTNGDERDPPNDIYSNPPVSPLANANGPPPFSDRFVEAWNGQSGLRPARKLTGRRVTKLKARAKEFGEDEMLAAVRRLGASPFHCGKNDREWQADIGWLIRNDENVAKALELPEPTETLAAKPARTPEEWLAYCEERASHFRTIGPRGAQFVREWEERATNARAKLGIVVPLMRAG